MIIIGDKKMNDESKSLLILIKNSLTDSIDLFENLEYSGQKNTYYAYNLFANLNNIIAEINKELENINKSEE